MQKVEIRLAEVDDARRIMTGAAPKTIREVAACVALDRPGPLKTHQDRDFLDRCHDPSVDVCPWTTDPADGDSGVTTRSGPDVWTRP